MKYGFLSATLLSLALAACQAPTPQQPLAGHLSTETSLPQARGDIPAPVQQTLAVPKPRTTPKTETYSVVVNNVQVKDLLFALARDAKVNVDIHPGITGVVSLNAINQTLPQLLTRISKQVDMRFELDGPNLSVMPDSPFLKHYKVDYVNMARNVTGTVSINTQIATSRPWRRRDRGRRWHPGCRWREYFQDRNYQHLEKPVLGATRKEHQGHPARNRQGFPRRIERNRHRAGKFPNLDRCCRLAARWRPTRRPDHRQRLADQSGAGFFQLRPPVIRSYVAVPSARPLQSS